MQEVGEAGDCSRLRDRSIVVWRHP